MKTTILILLILFYILTAGAAYYYLVYLPKKKKEDEAKKTVTPATVASVISTQTPVSSTPIIEPIKKEEPVLKPIPEPIPNIVVPDNTKDSPETTTLILSQINEIKNNYSDGQNPSEQTHIDIDSDIMHKILTVNEFQDMNGFVEPVVRLVPDPIDHVWDVRRTDLFDNYIESRKSGLNHTTAFGNLKVYAQKYTIK